MTRSIMPAFTRYPQEATIIGHLLAGYGEIEFELTACLAEILNNEEIAVRTMFRVRSEGQRLEIADALTRYKFEEAGLGTQYKQAFDAVIRCKKLRNQFSHCHWADDPNRGLVFTNLESTAETRSGGSFVTIRRIDLALLQDQEAYFCYTSSCLAFLRYEYRRLAGRLKSHPFPMPQTLPPPKLHIPHAIPPN
mgnify:FL=1